MKGYPFQRTWSVCLIGFPSKTYSWSFPLVLMTLQGAYSFPRFYAYLVEQFRSLMGPWSPAKFFSDTEVKWLSLFETEQWWMDSGRDSDGLPFWLARWLPSVCSRIADGMSILLRFQSVLVYKSKNSFLAQWIRKGQKSFEKPPTRYWHCFLFINYSKIGDHNCHLNNIWNKRKKCPSFKIPFVVQFTRESPPFWKVLALIL